MKAGQTQGKAIGQTTVGRNLRVTIAIAALAAVLLVLTLVAVYQTAPTTSDRGVSPAMSAEGKGVPSGVYHDPVIDRHAEVVARYHEDGLR